MTNFIAPITSEQLLLDQFSQSQEQVLQQATQLKNK